MPRNYINNNFYKACGINDNLEWIIKTIFMT